jgi:hypothetical protein
VPASVASGTYRLTVTASDGTRQRTSVFPVTVDGTSPSAFAPGFAFRSGGSLDDGVTTVGTWPAATDPDGSISRYEVRWRVDGNLGTTSSQSSADRTATRRLHPGHTYALRVRARDAAGNWSPWVESPALSPALSQDTSPSLIRSGRWTRYRATWASGGTAIYATHRGAYVRRNFTGRAVAWIGSKSRTRGRARIYIDGAYVTTVDLKRSGTANRQVIYARSWSTAGPHAISVHVVGTPGRRRVDVDAFVIVP